MHHLKLYGFTFLIWVCITSGLEYRYGVKFAEIFSVDYIIGTMGLWVTSYLIAVGVMK